MMSCSRRREEGRRFQYGMKKGRRVLPRRPHRVQSPARTYFRAKHYHRRLLLNDRVRNGIGWDQQPMGTGRWEEWKCNLGSMADPSRTPRSDMREGNQADRVISTARLNMLPCVQLPPINVVVSHDPDWDT